MTKKEFSKFYVDELVVRLIAAQVCILTTISLLNHWVFSLFLLTIDFALRAFSFFLSPLTAVAKVSAKLLRLKPKLIFGTPKKFAAGVGFMFSLIVALLFTLQIYGVGYIVAGVLIFCAILESVFKVCIGCYVFDYIILPIMNKKK
jgi:hypothetical protein